MGCSLIVVSKSALQNCKNIKLVVVKVVNLCRQPKIADIEELRRRSYDAAVVKVQSWMLKIEVKLQRKTAGTSQNPVETGSKQKLRMYLITKLVVGPFVDMTRKKDIRKASMEASMIKTRKETPSMSTAESCTRLGQRVNVVV